MTEAEEHAGGAGMEGIPRGTYTWLKVEEMWGVRIDAVITPGTILDVRVVRRDASGRTLEVEVFWSDGKQGISLGKFTG